jgi:hypothetical protein
MQRGLGFCYFDLCSRFGIGLKLIPGVESCAPRDPELLPSQAQSTDELLAQMALVWLEKKLNFDYFWSHGFKALKSITHATMEPGWAIPPSRQTATNVYITNPSPAEDEASVDSNPYSQDLRHGQGTPFR